jgi:non-ribosomal peptide synthetase component E (peptide arylation enzyme)
VAVVALAGHGTARLTLPEVSDHCRAKGLAVYKTPEQLEIVDEIPRTELGKAQKPALKARFALTEV